jgi:hypothetical protein
MADNADIIALQFGGEIPKKGILSNCSHSIFYIERWPVKDMQVVIQKQ